MFIAAFQLHKNSDKPTFMINYDKLQIYATSFSISINNFTFQDKNSANMVVLPFNHHRLLSGLWNLSSKIACLAKRC